MINWLDNFGQIGWTNWLVKVRKHKRKVFPNEIKDKRNYYKRVITSITYHPNFPNLKDSMSFLTFYTRPGTPKSIP